MSKSTLTTDAPAPEIQPAEPETEISLDQIFAESTSGNLKPWISAILSSRIPYSQYDTNGYSAIHLSVWLNQPENISILIKQSGCPVDFRSQNMQTGLSLAAAKGNLIIIKILLDLGADIESKDLCGMTPLLCAAHNGQIQSLYVLLNRGADLKAKDISGSNAFHLAASKNHVSMLRVLLTKDFDLESTDDTNRTALHKSTAYNSLKATEFLLFSKCVRNPVDINGKTPAIIAQDVQIEGPRDLIKNFNDSSFFYSYFIYLYFGFWISIYFVYYSDIIQETFMSVVPSLVFNMVASFAIPMYVFVMKFQCDTVETSADVIEKNICEMFEAEKFEEIPKSQDVCYSCQCYKVQRSKHCKYMNRCVIEYDHYCYFMQKPIGKGNHRAFMALLGINFMSNLIFLYLLLRKLEKDIEYEYFSKYFMTIVYNFLELKLLSMAVSVIDMIVCWFNFWYFIVEFMCISQGITLNEALNRHKCKYLFKPKPSNNGSALTYQNPFNKGFINNWIDFMSY